MAVITSGVGAILLFSSGGADKVALIALRDVTTGDTLDIGPSGLTVELYINRAVVISVTSFVEIAANWAGTVVTMPSGLANDAGYLLVWGSGT